MSEKWKVSLVLIPSSLHSLAHPAREWARCVHLILLDFSVSVNVWWWKMWKHPRYSRFFYFTHCRSTLEHSDGVPASRIHGHSFIVVLMIFESCCPHTTHRAWEKSDYSLCLLLFYWLLIVFLSARWGCEMEILLSRYRSFESHQKNAEKSCDEKETKRRKMSYYRPADECLFWFEISELTFRWSPHFKNKSQSSLADEAGLHSKHVHIRCRVDEISWNVPWRYFINSILWWEMIERRWTRKLLLDGDRIKAKTRGILELGFRLFNSAICVIWRLLYLSIHVISCNVHMRRSNTLKHIQSA